MDRHPHRRPPEERGHRHGDRRLFDEKDVQTVTMSERALGHVDDGDVLGAARGDRHRLRGHPRRS